MGAHQIIEECIQVLTITFHYMLLEEDFCHSEIRRDPLNSREKFEPGPGFQERDLDLYSTSGRAPG